MTQSQHMSTYLARLYTLQDADTTGVYGKAKSELEVQMLSKKGRKTFDICSAQPKEEREYVASKFVEDGLKAEAREIVHSYWNGSEAIDYCVRVTIPDRS